MADTLVATLVQSDLDVRMGLYGPYWSDKDTGVIIYIDDGIDISYARTTDGGASWNLTEIRVGSVIATACFYDKEVPGDSGSLLHVAWLDALGTDAARYFSIDVASGVVGTIRIVDNTITTDPFANRNRIAITKTISGNIIVAFSTQTEIGCYKSSDNFATAGTAIADVYETTGPADWCLLYPAATGDDNDACALFWDISADELSVKMWDDSVGTWTETSISGSMVVDGTHINMDGAVRHSDSHLLVAAHSNDDDAGDDLMTWDLTVDSIASPTVTAKTNVVTDQPESAQVAVFINQQNDNVYIAHLKGGTWQATVDVVFHISTDGMGSWGAEQAYSESAADDFRVIQAGRTVGNDGGRYQPVFFDSDEIDIYINETNDIEIAAVSVEEAISEAGPVAAAFGIPLVIVPGRAVSY